MRLSIVLAFVVCSPVFGTTLFSDDFDSLNPGILDKNDASSANPAPNGSGNPWWGPPNGSNAGGSPPLTNTLMSVVTAQNGVTPHSGAQMLRGTNGSSDTTQVWQNIAYRYNGGAVINGNLSYTFWFYDTNGATNGSTYQTNGAITHYSLNASNADYPPGQNLQTSTGSTIERLQLGAANRPLNTAGFPQTYDPTHYQARVIGLTTGYNNNGWTNLPLVRSIGWHEAEIAIGPQNPDKSNTVSFYIDNLNTPLLTATTTINQGYSDMELTSEGTSVGYFDDVTLIATPEPAGPGVLLVFAGGLTRRVRGRAAA